jgi:F-type H+-transporting ATPase subunit epsilon
MPDTTRLQVATPERMLVEEDVAEVQIPARTGYLGILPGHAPLLGELGTGFLSYLAGAKRRYLSVSGGFLEVLPDRIRVLANIAERAEEVDVERARRALQRAQEQLENPALGVDPAAALEAMERAQARLEAVAHNTSPG